MGTMVPDGAPVKNDGRRVYYKGIRDTETGIVYHKHDDVLLNNLGETRLPFVGKIDAIWVTDSVSYVRTKWYYRLHDITDEDDVKKIPPFNWSKEQQKALEGVDVERHECFLNPAHMDTNEASSILGPCIMMGMDNFLKYIEKQRGKRKELFHAPKDLRDVLFCRFKYSSSRGTYTAYVPESRQARTTKATSSNSHKRKRSASSSSGNDTNKQRVTRSRSSSESPSTNMSSSFSSSSSSSNPRATNKDATSSSSSTHSTHISGRMGGQGMKKVKNDSSNGSHVHGNENAHRNRDSSDVDKDLVEIAERQSKTKGKTGAGGRSGEDSAEEGAEKDRETPNDLPREARVGERYQLEPTRDLPAPGSFKPTRPQPSPMWLAEITERSGNSNIDVYLRTLGAAKHPDNFHAFALGALMHANGNCRVALATMKSVGSMPTLPDAPQPAQEKVGSSSSLSFSSSKSANSALSSASSENLNRRTSSRVRVRAAANVLPKYGNDLEPDFMSPEWATRIITGLGRLLVPYHTPREKVAQGGRSGGILAGSPKPKGADSDSDSEQDRNSDKCSICQRGGKLLCCDGCDAAFHLACVNLRVTPRNKEWFCMPCQQRREMSKYIHKESVGDPAPAEAVLRGASHGQEME